MGLFIFEKHPLADAYRMGGTFTPHAIAAKDKRFTDAELAADMFAATATSAQADVHGLLAGEGPAGHAFFAVSEHECRLAEVLERFATHPHHDEPTA